MFLRICNIHLPFLSFFSFFLARGGVGGEIMPINKPIGLAPSSSTSQPGFAPDECIYRSDVVLKGTNTQQSGHMGQKFAN